MDSFVPPESVRGMKYLDKSAFVKTVNVEGVCVPKRRCQEAVKALRKASQCLRVTGVAPVREVPGDQDSMLVLVVPGVETSAYPAVVTDMLQSGAASMSETPVSLDFTCFSTTQILDSVLPREVARISSFATIGHMAHLNLRREQEPYKAIIGEVILEKNRSIRTVVNKTHGIDNTFRTFSMEVLAGDESTEVTHNENGCVFKFDFAKVFWNSRLSGEHHRIVEMLNSGDVVCDVFAGVGPFAVPAAKRGCRIYANDLNSSSASSMEENCQLNRVAKRVSVFNLDGRCFIKEIASKVTDGKGADGACSAEWPMFNHVLMNLPAIAIEFLDAFRGVFAGHDDLKLPMVHCYCFSSADNPQAEVVDRVKAALGVTDVGNETTIHEVRSVAIAANQYCISFRLPRTAAMADINDSLEPDAKRAKLDT